MMNPDAKSDAPAQEPETYQPKQQQVIATVIQVCSARFTPCGNYLIAGGFDAQIYRWDMTGEEAAPLEPVTGHNGWPASLVFHPTDGVMYSADSWGQIRATRYAEEKPEPKWTLPTAHDGWVRSLAISPNGKLLASVGMDKMVRLFDTVDGHLVREIDGHQEDVYSAAFHPDGESLVTGDLRGVIKEWNVADGSHQRDIDASQLFLYRNIQECGGALQLAFSPTGKRLAVGGLQPTLSGTVRGTPTVLIFDWKSGKLEETQEHGEDIDAFVHDVHFTSDDEVMLVTSGTPGRGQLIVQQVGAEEPKFLTNKMPNCHSLSVSPDARRLAVVTTVRASNGNGRRLDKDGNYVTNTSPIHLFELPAATA